MFILSLNTVVVTDMSTMFQGASNFNIWDTAVVPNMSTMFQGASIFNRDVLCWDIAVVLLK